MAGSGEAAVVSTGRSGLGTTRAHPLSDGTLWAILGIAAVLTLLAALTFFRFTADLDVANPDAGALRGLLSWMFVALLGSTALLVWSGRVHIHPVMLASALVLAFLVGIIYGTTAFLTDFHDGLIFGRFFVYQLIQGVLLTMGALAFLAGVVIWRSAPPRAPMWIAGLVALPVALQTGFHGGIAIGVWTVLPELIDMARELNGPQETPGPALLATLILLIGLAWARHSRR